MTPPENRFEAQRRAAGIARSENMWWVYILELKPDEEGQRKYYVGHTCKLQRRMHDHMTSNRVAWVRRRGVQSVQHCIRTTEESALGLEIARPQSSRLSTDGRMFVVGSTLIHEKVLPLPIGVHQLAA